MTQPLIPTESLGFAQARPIISKLLDRVFRREMGVRIFKGSAPVAAIVSIRDLERLEKCDRERAERFRALESQAEKFADVPPFELEVQIANAFSVVGAANGAVDDGR